MRRFFLAILVVACLLVLSSLFSFGTPKVRASTIPGGVWINPGNNFTITRGGFLHLAAHAYRTNPSDPPIAYVQFTAYWNGLTSSQWPVVERVYPTPGTDVFSSDWNLTYNGQPIPSGAIEVSFDVYDQSGNFNLAPNGIHSGTVTAATQPYDAGNYGGKSSFVSIDTSGRFNEPNDIQHVNYCGPAASQELISAWTSNVPALQTLASEEQTVPSGPNAGTLMTNMVGPINSAIGQNYYSVNYAGGSEGNFSNQIGRDILDNHHPLITGLLTIYGSNHLNGWKYVAAPHIVTIYGFDFRSPSAGYIYYNETASTVAGATNGPGRNSINYATFWSLVQQNDIQLS